MTEVDETLAPPGHRARLQTHREMAPLGIPSCEGCAFENEPGGSGACASRPCSHYERPDKQSVIFEKIP